jgi:two-component system response regulator YesN
MYTILLVDDELPILETLKSSIPWQQFGIDTLMTATDGIQALEKMKKQRIDLLITDIRMPNMDGLELLHQVRSLYPDTHCVLLTAYSDFEYARKAIQLGVDNYLLKPFQEEEMEETIEKVLDNIYISRGNSKDLFRDNILRRWVTGRISTEELSERSSLLDINIYLPNYCVVCIRKKHKSGCLSHYCASCIEDLSSDYEVYQFWDDKGHYVFIIGGKQITAAQLTDSFISLAGQLKVSSRIALSVGPVVKNSDDLTESYQTACNLIETADLSGCSLVVLTKEKFTNLESELLIKELNSLFHQSNEESRKTGYQKLAISLLNRLKKQDLNMVFSQLTHNLFRLFKQEFPNRPGIQDQIQSRVYLFSAASTHENFVTAVEELLEYSYLLFRYYFEQLSPIIQHTISYVHEHYSDSLSIKEFCAKNKMSTAYLGYLFKKETGMFFNSYLNQYRICCSIQLLVNSNQNINDIAKNVGFCSTSYFISSFKKQTGISPNKYRALQLDEEA